MKNNTKTLIKQILTVTFLSATISAAQATSQESYSTIAPGTAKDNSYAPSSAAKNTKKQSSLPSDSTPTTESTPTPKTEKPSVNILTYKDNAKGASTSVSTKSIIDSDGDGITLNNDECRQTSLNINFDSLGCYPSATDNLRFKLNIVFNNDSAKIRKKDIAEVKLLVDFLRKYEEAQITIEGHTDNKASEKYNQKLSEQRAASVYKMLVGTHGIPEEQVSTVGYGESKPVANNKTSEGRQKNRRVMAEIKPKSNQQKDFGLSD